MYLLQAFQNNSIKMIAFKILKGFKVNNPVWQCGVEEQGWNRNPGRVQFNWVQLFDPLRG